MAAGKHIGLLAGALFFLAFLLVSAHASVADNHAAGLKIRPAAQAGSWYPGAREPLLKMVNDLLAKAEPSVLDGPVIALITPHAGYQYSGLAAAHAFKLLTKGQFRTVVLMGPSHEVAFHGCLIANVDAYQTPLGTVPLDNAICRKLFEHPLFKPDDTAHVNEYSLEMELPFLQAQLGEFRLVPIVVGALNAADYEAAAQRLRECMPDDALYVVSSDFTHYGASYDYVPFKENIRENLGKLDAEAIRLICADDFDGFEKYLARTGSTICGQAPIGILLKLLPADAKGTLLKYYTSGDLAGDWSTSVSYAAIGFSRPSSSAVWLTKDDEKALLRVARDTLESYVNGGKTPDEQTYHVTPALRKKGAAFVTLTINGELRGCIGSLEAVEPLCGSVMDNVANASRDSRFPQPVQPAELAKIDIEISVLSDPAKVASLSDVVIGKHGVILDKNGLTAVFLPEVAVQQKWNREQLAENLCIKAGLPPDAWKRGAVFRVFTAQVFRESEFRKPQEKDWLQY